MAKQKQAKTAVSAVVGPVAPKADAEAKLSRNVVPLAWREKVGKLGSCGDALAQALGTFLGESKNGERMAKLEALARANELDLAKWAGKNVGMVRMDIGNVLRGRVVRGEKVVVPGVRTWDAKPQPKPEAKAAPAKA